MEPGRTRRNRRTECEDDRVANVARRQVLGGSDSQCRPAGDSCWREASLSSSTVTLRANLRFGVLTFDERRAATLQDHARFVGRQRAYGALSRTKIDDLDVEGMAGIGQFGVVGKLVAQDISNDITA